MAVTYPLSVPSGLKVKNSSFRLVTNTSVSASDFTYAQQVYKHQGERWEGEVTLVPMTRAQAADIQAFLLKLRGQFGTFLYGDPDYLALGARGSWAGTPVVNGASQTGNSIDISGFTPSQTGVGKAGDYIQLGTGSDAKLYMVVNDFDSDGAGEATVDIEPALKTSPVNGSSVVSTGAKGLFRLSANSREWTANASNVHNITIAFTEAIDE